MVCIIITGQVTPMGTITVQQPITIFTNFLFGKSEHFINVYRIIPISDQHNFYDEINLNHFLCQLSNPYLTRQLGRPRSPANRFRSEHHNFCFIYIGYRLPLSPSTIWGNHLPVNFMLKFPTCILRQTRHPPPAITAKLVLTGVKCDLSTYRN